MKKIVGFIVVLGILFFVFQLGINLLKNSHTINYDLEVNNNKITVEEKYIKEGKNDYYLFKVVLGENSFVFDINNKFNKQKKVIENFKIYEKNSLICISPIYIKNNDDATVTCNIDKQQTSYITVKEKYNIDKFLESLNNFDFDKYVSFDSTRKLGKMSIYKDNIYKDEKIIVYDYKELIKITKGDNDKIKFSNYDVYNNEMGILINNYYILPSFENKPEYSSFLVIDINTLKKETIKFDKSISTNIYINGVVDNKLYFFDKSNLVQYEIDPEKNSYRIVGNKATNGQYYDGQWSTRNIYDFYRREIVFNKIYPIKETYVEAYESDKFYYYYNSKYEFYKVYKQELDNPIYLFQYDNIEEIQLINDKIYFIDDDTIYRYDDTGIKKIVTNNEFRYNYKNIYSAYFK